MPAKNLTYSGILFLITTLAALYTVQWVRAESRVAWTELETAEQEVLEPFMDQWDALSGERQGRLLTSARLWLAMAREERAVAQQRLDRWQALPSERRQRIQQLIERFQALPPQRQEQLRKVRDWYSGLPAEKQASLRQRWQLAVQPEPSTKPADAPEKTPARPSAQPSSEATRGESGSAREAQPLAKGEEAEWKALEHQLRDPDTPEPHNLPGGAPFDAEQHRDGATQPSPDPGGGVDPGGGDLGAGRGVPGK